MAYELISVTKRTARKQHDCIWCRELILPRDIYIREVSVYDGLQTFSWHPECKTAADKFFREECAGESEFEAHACKRGTSEEL